MFNIGEKVSFFSPTEEFTHIEYSQIDNYISDLSWYVVEDMGDDWLDVKSESGNITIHVNQVYDEYMVFTRTQLKEHLISLKSNDKYSAICNKIKQLYRKQQFQFQGA